MSTIHINWKNHSESLILNAFLQAAIQHNAAVVFWNEPNAKQLYLLVNFKSAVACQLSDTLSSGFIFSPFTSANKACFFLQAELLYCFENQQFLEKNSLNKAQQQNFLKTILNSLEKEKKTNYFVTETAENNTAELKAHFIALVEKSLEQIKKTDLQKVVCARTKTVDLAQSFDLIEAFQNIRRTYPQHFISLISTPEYGTWLGCSPELLLAINGQQLQTLSLAGTKLKNQPWTTKEHQEQALVTEFIRQQLQQLNISDFNESAVHNLTIGAFKHLQTQFSIQLNSQQLTHQIAEQLLALLHPTPAICGMPKQQALDFIQQYENFDRQLYCGYLGPCHIDSQQTRVYVNIRCMQLLAHQAILYAGAGITEASDPEKEWEETHLKCQTLLDFL